MKNIFFFFFILVCYKINAINPQKEYLYTPNDFNIKFHETFLNVDDYKLCLWICEPKMESKNSTILLVYGDSGNMSYYLNYIEFYTNLGYTVISFDYRLYGKSSSFNYDEKILYYNEFVTDLDNVIKFCKNDLKINNLNIVSLSMGTIITSFSNEIDKVNKIIIEGAVYDSSEIIQRLKPKEVYLPSNSYNSAKKWLELDKEILIFSANNDKLTTVEDSNIIQKINSAMRKLVVYQGSHLSILNTEKNRDLYEHEVIKFLN